MQTRTNKPQRFYETAGYVFMYGNAVTRFSNEHANAIDTFKEAEDNSVDSHARTVVHVITPTMIQFIDDGEGMVPFMSDQAHETIAQFFEDIDNKRVNYEVKKRIADQDKKSLEWLAALTAFSWKTEKSKEMRGQFAIGIQTYRILGNQVVIRSRPSRELAKAYWGRGPEVTNPPVYEYRFPTVEDIEKYDIRVEITKLDTPLLDHTGHELEHGTVVEITDLKDGVLQSLRPSYLTRQLQERFGADVGKGIRIGLLDCYSEVGRKKKQGSLTWFEPARFKGRLIFNETLSLPSGGTFKVELYFAPNSKSENKVQIRRVGAPVGEINSLTEFSKSKSPFTTGLLAGYVEFPARDDAIWDSQKKIPLVGKVRQEWQRVIWDEVVPIVLDKIEELENQSQNAKLMEISQQVADAMKEVIQVMDDLPPITIQRGKQPSKTEKPEKPGSKHDLHYVEHRLLIEVKDEHNLPVPGVDVFVYYEGELVRRNVTKSSGLVSVGKDLHQDEDFPSGRFVIGITVPDGMESYDGMVEQDVVLNDAYPGRRVLFRVRTGRPGPQPVNIVDIRARFVKDLGEIYSASKFRMSGVIEIDEEMGDYAEALRDDDWDRIAELTSLYLAHGIIEALFNASAFPEPAPIQLKRAADMSAKALGVIRQRSNRKGKRK